jgi:hypothetical protein
MTTLQSIKQTISHLGTLTYAAAAASRVRENGGERRGKYLFMKYFVGRQAGRQAGSSDFPYRSDSSMTKAKYRLGADTQSVHTERDDNEMEEILTEKVNSNGTLSRYNVGKLNNHHVSTAIKIAVKNRVVTRI